MITFLRNIPYYVLCVVIFSCGNPAEEKTDVKEETSGRETSPAISAPSNMDVWAERIRCSGDIERTSDFSPEDWEEVTEKIDTGKMLSTIINAVLTGKAKAYHPIFDTMVLPAADVKNLLERRDTFITVDPNTGSEELIVVSVRNSIDNIHFVERWYFDPEKFRMQKEVLSVAPVRKVYGPNGEFRGNQILFWVPLKNGEPAG